MLKSESKHVWTMEKKPGVFTLGWTYITQNTKDKSTHSSLIQHLKPSAEKQNAQLKLGLTISIWFELKWHFIWDLNLYDPICQTASKGARGRTETSLSTDVPAAAAPGGEMGKQGGGNCGIPAYTVQHKN